MPMVTRVRNALRRLIEDYGSSGSDEEKQDRSGGKTKGDSRRNSAQSKKSDGSKIFFRSSKLETKKSTASNDENSSSSPGSVDEDAGELRDDGEPALGGLLGSNHPTDETPSLDMVATETNEADVVDGDENSSGRVRAFAHFPGNWATFVYIVPRIEGLEALFNNLYSEISRISDNVTASKWALIDEPHVSLSRTVPLRYHQIPQFTGHLKSELKKASIAKISYAFDDVEVYTNDQANTSFLALKVGRGQEDLAALSKVTDSCLKAYNMPPFYEQPEFHVSFAWCTEKMGETEKVKILSYLRKKLEVMQSQHGEDLVQYAKAVHCRSGNRSYLMPL